MKLWIETGCTEITVQGLQWGGGAGNTGGGGGGGVGGFSIGGDGVGFVVLAMSVKVNFQCSFPNNECPTIYWVQDFHGYLKLAKHPNVSSLLINVLNHT